MTPGTTFDAWVWVGVLRGNRPDPSTLARLRLTPPRLRTRERVDANALGVPTWEPVVSIPLSQVAEHSAVAESTARRRCREWGIETHVRVVGWGPGWRSRRQTVLLEPAYQAYMARTLRPSASGRSSRGSTPDS